MSPVRYSIIYADPPWDYKGQKQHAGAGSEDTGGAETHYETVTLDELKRLSVLSVCAPDCLLFMWATSPHLDQAIDLMKGWGFAWATVAFVWDKQRVNPGFYTLSQVELVLVGKRGKIPTPRGSRNERQLVSELRGEHSVKPEQVRQRIEAMFPTQAKLELFARRPAPGWDVWGDEIETQVSIPWPRSFGNG
jgi:N6-adenosine-specific RNA methylase IME4